MGLNKNKKGQAAIEFLMTYGWMLLVVLIVGALIFSFVDFGSLLPNRLELSNNLRGSATESTAMAGSADGNLIVVFTYNGAKRAEIAGDGFSVARDDSATGCTPINITNVDTGADATSTAPVGKVTFLNGQTGVLRMKCATPPLIAGDVLEGQITINVTSIKTKLSIPSKGAVRLAIN